MNSCVLMVRVVDEPQLRYTPDNQTEVAHMMVEFASLKSEDPPNSLKVVGWRNLALEMQEKYHSGDQLIVIGSLRMNTIERQEGFREKRAELTAYRIEKIGAGGLEGQSQGQENRTPATTAEATSSNVVPFDFYKPSSPEAAEDGDFNSTQASAPASEPTPDTPRVSATPDFDEQNLDDIPF